MRFLAFPTFSPYHEFRTDAPALRLDVSITCGCAVYHVLRQIYPGVSYLFARIPV